MTGLKAMLEQLVVMIHLTTLSFAIAAESRVIPDLTIVFGCAAVANIEQCQNIISHG